MTCSTDKITNNTAGEKVYPWSYTLDRGMSWQGIGYEEWKKGKCKNGKNENDDRFFRYQ